MDVNEEEAGLYAVEEEEASSVDKFLYFGMTQNPFNIYQFKQEVLVFTVLRSSMRVSSCT